MATTWAAFAAVNGTTSSLVTLGDQTQELAVGELLHIPTVALSRRIGS